jgi:hypothetical protein
MHAPHFHFRDSRSIWSILLARIELYIMEQTPLGYYNSHWLFQRQAGRKILLHFGFSLKR